MRRVCASSQPGERARLAYLDGLRGWAAFVVLLFHATWEMFGDYLPAIRLDALGVLTDGPLAVHVFFVLSGLVLSHAYLRSGDEQALSKMAVGRYPRLVIPILVASFIGFVLMRGGLMYNQSAVHLLGKPYWLGLFYGFEPSALGWLRFSFVDAFVGSDIRRSYDVCLWTMPIELFGSFALFGLLFVAGRRVVIRRLCCLVLAIAAWTFAPLFLGFVYGVVLADLLTSERLARVREGRAASAAGGALVVFGCACSPLLHHGGEPHAAASLASVLVLGVSLSVPARRFLQGRFSQWLGAISFPLYLLHSFVFCSLGCAMALWLDRRGIHGAALAATVVPVVVLASLGAAQLFLPVEAFAKGASRFLSSKAGSLLAGHRRTQLATGQIFAGRTDESSAPSV